MGRFSPLEMEQQRVSKPTSCLWHQDLAKLYFKKLHYWVICHEMFFFFFPHLEFFHSVTKHFTGENYRPWMVQLRGKPPKKPCSGCDSVTHHVVLQAVKEGKEIYGERSVELLPFWFLTLESSWTLWSEIIVVECKTERVNVFKSDRCSTYFGRRCIFPPRFLNPGFAIFGGGRPSPLWTHACLFAWRCASVWWVSGTWCCL